MLRLHETLGHAVVEHLDQRIEVARDVEHAARPRVDPELGPGDDFEQFLEGAEPARERHECIGELGHQRLALVHRVHDAKRRQPFVRDLALDQGLRNHPDHHSFLREGGVGQAAHQADVGSPVDETDATFGQAAAELTRRRQILGPAAGARPAEHADPPH